MIKILSGAFLNQTVNKMVRNNSVFGAVLRVESGDSSFSWAGEAGDLKADDSYYIASVTKLYITVIMLMLRAENKLSFTDKVYTFFPEALIGELKENWNMIYFPGQFYFGLGLEKIWTPRIISPFKPIKEVLGFWGQTGAFAFHNPETDLYFTGTVNQVSGMGHSAAYKAMINIIKAWKGNE